MVVNKKYCEIKDMRREREMEISVRETERWYKCQLNQITSF